MADGGGGVEDGRTDDFRVSARTHTTNVGTMLRRDRNKEHTKWKQRERTHVNIMDWKRIRIEYFDILYGRGGFWGFWFMGKLG